MFNACPQVLGKCSAGVGGGADRREDPVEQAPAGGGGTGAAQCGNAIEKGYSTRPQLSAVMLLKRATPPGPSSVR